MSFPDPDLDMALTQLTERLLDKDQTCAETYVMAKGQLYRTELRLHPIHPRELPADF
ncbi:MULTISPECIES: hypothetical protein [unclassified Halomonas]|uniref:hypothetical protein n=1 Tax=unclassified Halomonas TaxID=2609666 RepID=UPI0020769078|nr:MULTISPECIES: hypothetical protein [unclassified Halomonas]